PRISPQASAPLPTCSPMVRTIYYREVGSEHGRPPDRTGYGTWQRPPGAVPVGRCSFQKCRTGVHLFQRDRSLSFAVAIDLVCPIGQFKGIPPCFKYHHELCPCGETIAQCFFDVLVDFLFFVHANYTVQNLVGTDFLEAVVYLFAVPVYPCGNDMDMVVRRVLMEYQEVGLLTVAHAVQPLFGNARKLLLAMGTSLAGNDGVELWVFRPLAGSGLGFQIIDIIGWAEILQGLQGTEICHFHEFALILVHFVRVITNAFERGGRFQYLDDHVCPLINRMSCRMDCSSFRCNLIYSDSNGARSRIIAGCNIPCCCRVLACFASWLILLPDRPISVPILSSSFMISVVLTSIFLECWSTRIRTMSARLRPSAFSSSRNCARSASLNRSSKRRVRC